MHALLCLGQWSAPSLIRDCDMKAGIGLNKAEEEGYLAEGWDAITA